MYYKVNYSRSPYLVHHGIKGQKWGIRRWQNPDGSLTEEGKKRYGEYGLVSLNAGSKMRHISGKRKIKLEDKETYIYDPDFNNGSDDAIYKGAYAKYLQIGMGFMKQYAHDYITTEDLVSPGYKGRVKMFVEAYKENPVVFSSELNKQVQRLQDLEYMGYSLSEGNKAVASVSKKYDANTDDNTLSNIGYQTMMRVAENGSTKSKAVKAYYEKVLSKGYNALVDDNNLIEYNNAQTPFIALNGKKSLKEIGITKRVSRREQRRSEDAVKEANRKRTGVAYMTI